MLFQNKKPCQGPFVHSYFLCQQKPSFAICSNTVGAYRQASPWWGLPPCWKATCWLIRRIVSPWGKVQSGFLQFICVSIPPQLQLKVKSFNPSSLRCNLGCWTPIFELYKVHPFLWLINTHKTSRAPQKDSPRAGRTHCTQQRTSWKRGFRSISMSRADRIPEMNGWEFCPFRYQTFYTNIDQSIELFENNPQKLH